MLTAKEAFEIAKQYKPETDSFFMNLLRDIEYRSKQGYTDSNTFPLNYAQTLALEKLGYTVVDRQWIIWTHPKE